MGRFNFKSTLFFYLYLMKIQLWLIGKTDDSYLNTGIDKYAGRLKFYISLDFQIFTLPKNLSNLSELEQKKKEGDLILKKINPSDYLVLLDEKGKIFSSKKFANYLEGSMNKNVQNLIFLIGGPFGFSDEIYERANDKISLSAMTFSHQMVRLFFMEQLYRAFTIIKGEKYHHE